MTARAPARSRSSALAPDRIGRVRGAARQHLYRRRVCAKVARYAERVHHPDRLTAAAAARRRQGRGQRRVPADRLGRRARRGRRGLRARDAAPRQRSGLALLLRRHDGPGAARRHRPAAPCRCAIRARRRRSAPRSRRSPAGSPAPASKRGVDPREMAESDLIVVWGGNPVATQVNVMTHIAGRGRSAAPSSSSSIPIAPARPKQADMHLARAARHRRRARLRRDACAVQGRLRRPRLSGALHRRARTSSRRICARATPTGRPRSPACRSTRSWTSRGSTAATKRSFLRIGYGFSRSRNGSPICTP